MSEFITAHENDVLTDCIMRVWEPPADEVDMLVECARDMFVTELAYRGWRDLPNYPTREDCLARTVLTIENC
jgi:hypothetical protein